MCLSKINDTGKFKMDQNLDSFAPKIMPSKGGGPPTFFEGTIGGRKPKQIGRVGPNKAVSTGIDWGINCGLIHLPKVLSCVSSKESKRF